MRLYMMFVYVDDVAYNSMGIKGTLDEIYNEAARISKEIYSINPRAEVKTKINFWN